MAVHYNLEDFIREIVASSLENIITYVNPFHI